MSESEEHLPENSNGTQNTRIRRLKACKHCHSLKVRCAPVDANDPYSPCVRCINANKVCEIDSVEQRKKRKKSPRQELELVALLKEQISDLKKQLKEQSTGTSSPSTASSGNAHTSLHSHVDSPISGASDVSSPLYMTRMDLEKELSLLGDIEFSLKDVSDELRHFSILRRKIMDGGKKVDVVSLGLLTLEEAEARLEQYKTVIYPLHPFVFVPAEHTVEYLRQNLPFLFNAIMIPANMIRQDGDFEASLALELQAISAVVNEILVAGTKSIELIKSLIIISIWYNTPECFKLRRYHIFINIALVILHDLGTNKKPTPYESKSASPADLDERDPEYRSLVLTLYLCTVTFCLILRRTVHAKWTPYVEECCSVFEKSSNENHKRLAVFARLHHELERVYHLVHSAEGPSGNSHITKYAFNELLGSLQKIKPQIKPEDHTTMAYYNSVESFLHQPLFEDLRIRQGVKNTKQSLSLRTLDAIGHCTDSCLLALTEFNKLSDEAIACLPLIHFSRIVYTAGILMRLRYFILSSPSHVEKELVPRHAVLAILTLNKRIFSVSTKYKANFFLKKMMLILLLFVNTYLSQTSELLLSEDALAPQLPPIVKRDMSEVGYFANSILEPSRNSLNAEAAAPCLHLELLSYAATEFRKSKESQTSTFIPSVKSEDPSGLYPVSKPAPAGSTLLPPTQDVFPANNTFKYPPLTNGIDASKRPPFGKLYSLSSNTLRNGTLFADLQHNSDVSGPSVPSVHPGGFYDYDLSDRRNSVLNIDDEFWANLVGNNADSFYFAQETPIHTENVL
ncbi:hypothetical protein PUMCH_004168 [Australozyma saopauloensis]|uniref:Zn(2)-C6 fungal-type domain-containing protein n=1 Tax=Australozyma saopauloensis TaxID=291208 RepID=A0AAX4HDV4_9ASCO|nr:hypothetical protein PUMCH_004168 [[Candida] saopauloensis]